MGDMTRNFSRSEFACKCGCGFNTINETLVGIVQGIRDSIGAPLHVASGCRCAKRNAAVEGRVNSAHTRGLAVDLQCTDSRTRYEIIHNALRAGVKRVGVYDTFVHIDLDDSLPQEVIWND